MKQLDELTRTALLGLNRTRLPDLKPRAPAERAKAASHAVTDDSNAPHDLAALLAQLSGQAPEAALLNAAGIIGIYRQAGQTTVALSALASAAPSVAPTAAPARGKSCPPGAAYHLSLMLEGRHAPLLDELLAALAAGGYTAPAPLLPLLLERGQKHARLRPAILAVLDDAGRRLASENPDWRYAGAQADSYAGLRALWQATDDPRARQGLLRQSRALEPAWGRRLLESSWKTLADAQRLGLFVLLADGLTMEDEPFLETALDDRSHSVRRKAAELLAHLPASRLAQRMASRIDATVRLTPDAEQPVQIFFEAELSPELIRDGVLPRSGKNVAQLRGLQLMEMVSAVPLDHWTSSWDMTAGDVVLTMRAGLWPRTLTQALCAAAVRQRNERWALALLDATGLHEHALRAVPALPLGAGDEMLAKWPSLFLEDEPLNKRSRLTLFLRQQPAPWPPLMTRRFWRQLAKLDAAEDQKSDFIVDSLIKQSARSCLPELLDEGIVRLTDLPAVDQRARALKDALALLAFRRAMLADLTAAARK